METLGISLYSYFYLKLAKTVCFSYYLLCFLFNKIGGTKGKNRFCLGAGRGGEGVAQIMYTHVNKFKNDKIKLKIKINK
jgi:hypothetical protein